MIGKRLSSLADVLCRHDVEVYVSEQELDEIRRVFAREKFDKLISAETRYYFIALITSDYCSGQTSVTISDSVTSIENHAFIGCSRLKSFIVRNR